MKNKKKCWIIIGIILWAILMIFLLVKQYQINQETKKLKEETQYLNTLDVKTKSGNTINTEYTGLDNGSFFIKIPTSFQVMSPEQIKKKYPNPNPPTFVFTNQETTINVAISLTTNQIKEEAIKSYAQMLQETLKNSYDILENKISNRDGHQIGKIKLISKAEDTDIYNHMLFFSDDGYLRIVAFNCTKNLKEEWESVGDFILDSLFFKTENKE